MEKKTVQINTIFLQVSYFEIYLDKIRDLLDGRIHFFISNYKLHIVSTILVALLNKHSI